MDAEALPTLPELKAIIGPGVGAWHSSRWWLAGGSALLLAGAGAWGFSHRASQRPIQYDSVLAARGDLAVTVESTGTLEAVTSVEVGSEVSGRVLRELVDVNDQVRKGQILAETRRGALLVPNAALRFTPPVGPGGLAKTGVNFADGRHRVWVLKGKRPEPIEVKTGASDGRHTEILSGGLGEGMRVLVDTKSGS